MPTLTILLIVLGTFLLPVGTRAADPGQESAGNTDGVLTWECGTLGPGASIREVVILAFDSAPDKVQRHLEEARRQFRPATEPRTQPSGPSPSGNVWIGNGTTDFALRGPGFFRWDMIRQALACPRGGQLSQFTYYLHYRDGSGDHAAGTLNHGQPESENIRVIEPVRALGPNELVGVVQTEDGKLRVRIRAVMGRGPVVAVEFYLTNLTREPLTDLRLSTYANLESAHDHENDLSFLDTRTAGLLVYDPPTGMCAVMAGLRRPARGFSGTWNSIGKLRAAEGVGFDRWRPFDPSRPDLLQSLAGELAAAEGLYLPLRYENPTTPATRTLTAEETETVLKSDWLFQAMNRPWAQRTAAEIEWTRALAARLAREPGTPNLGADLAELDGLEKRLRQLGPQAKPAVLQDLYFSIRAVKRRITFKNPVVDFAQVLFIDQPTPQGRVCPDHESIHRMGITATPGGRLLLLEGLHPGGRLRQLAPDKPGSFWRPDLSYDGRRVLYCFKPHEQKSFHLYEMNLDGTGRRQLTASDYDDIDPLYLPDGHILFTTTRGNSYVRCGPFIYSYILARCDAGGGNVYLMSYNGEPDFVPALLHDGRVIYSRWEYTDKPLWRVQSLWTTNQDGTNTMAFWGNQSVWPDHLGEPRPIPGSRRVMFAGVGHHDWFSGSIGIIDPDQGLNYPHGLTKVTADLRWPECSLPPEDRPESPHYHAAGPFTGYKTAYPLSAKDFLVSARGQGGKFRLYLMDVEGNRELIFEGAHNIWHALPVKPRAAPPRHLDRVEWPGTGKDRKPVREGVFFSPDVYEGVPDLPRGSARFLRVWQLDHKTYSTWKKTYRHSGPAVSIIQEDGVKRILSEVPVENDGSVHFKVPAGKSLYFQLLDENYRCLQTMRSFTGTMPGEVRGCIGCHELNSTTAPRKGGLAFRRPPTEVTPPSWGTQSVSFERFVQPVLDRHCVRCHRGPGTSEPNLALRPGTNVFKEPYLTLVGPAAWGNPIPNRRQPGYGIAGAIPVESMDPTMNDPRAYATLRPGQFLSSRSRLIDLASSGKHHGVRAGLDDLRRLMAWVDACCPFLGEEELRALGDPDFAGIDTLPIRPRVQTAPLVERP